MVRRAEDPDALATVTQAIVDATLAGAISVNLTVYDALRKAAPAGWMDLIAQFIDEGEDYSLEVKEAK